ncbi:PleD family two-component system response regulator [Paenibacillus sp. YYML68]|uniref:response regulator n=1 Tax=Paenibacillus sp. YYML68 TaxID=2909250 RepID=UPI00249034CB|nr:response regulator [Paenibacillus sp. YYML68]
MKQLVIVDDDTVLLSLLHDMFALRGLDVRTFDQPSEALAHIQPETTDAVLSDCLMPGMDGYSLCRELRSRPGFARKPIFIMSAKHSISELAKAMAAGADEYIIKPFQPDDIVQRLMAAYRKKHNPIVMKSGDDRRDDPH